MTDSKPTVLAVIEDLMFMVRIQDAAKRAGLEIVVIKSRENALRKAVELSPVLCIIDLNYTAGEPLEVIRGLKADDRTKNIHLLSFVSHVQTDLRAAALSAGSDSVLPRSAFVQSLGSILERCLKE